MSCCVWLPAEGHEAFLGALRAVLDPAVELVVGAVLPAGTSPGILVAGVPTAEQLAACPGLERVVIPYAGVPARTRSLVRERGDLRLHNLHHNAASTAELAVALLLAAAKAIVPHDRELRRGDWHRRYEPPTAVTLAGGHAVVLGYGAIGQRVSRALLALGMRVSAVRRSAREGDRHGMVALAPPSGLLRLLPEADAVVVCLPLTPETNGILDPVMIRSIRRGAMLVNVGRGALVDEAALYEALATEQLAGAGLDVWYRYPTDEAARTATLPAEHPFHELENVVLSPHRAGLTRQNETMRAHALAALLRAMARGAEVPNEVDLELGY